MEEVVFSNIAYYGRFATVAVIAIFGTACNAISLSFFLEHKKESLADKHLIFLNITDLLICILSPVALFCLSKAIVEGEIHLLLTIFAESYVSLSLLSCFITTMLSVTRTLVLTKPLYIIKRNLVYLAHSMNTIFSVWFSLSVKSFSTFMVRVKKYLRNLQSCFRKFSMGFSFYMFL